MTDRPRVLVVRNDIGSGPGRLVGWLSDAGIDVELVEGQQLLDDPAPVTMDDVDGLVLLGGGFMPDAEDRAPWLPVERGFVEHAAAHEVPLLGICLGGQLLAQVAGGRVTANSGEIERGCCDVELLPAATDDPLFGPLFGPVAPHRTLRMIQNHRDSITSLPPGATLLATSPACRVQAFRVGERAWGLQFHPEAATDRVSGWDPDRLRADGFDPATLIADAQAAATTNDLQARALLTAFADLVHSGRHDGTNDDSVDNRVDDRVNDRVDDTRGDSIGEGS